MYNQNTRYLIFYFKV